MTDPETPSERNERHAREIERSQKGLRDSIAETGRLLDESNRMLDRHREEREGDES